MRFRRILVWSLLFLVMGSLLNFVGIPFGTRHHWILLGYAGVIAAVSYFLGYRDGR
jgi:uncharacterized membrane protein